MCFVNKGIKKQKNKKTKKPGTACNSCCGPNPLVSAYFLGVYPEHSWLAGSDGTSTNLSCYHSDSVPRFRRGIFLTAYDLTNAGHPKLLEGKWVMI